MRGDWKFPVWPSYKKSSRNTWYSYCNKIVKRLFTVIMTIMFYSLPIFCLYKYFICLCVWITCVLTYSDVFGVESKSWIFGDVFEHVCSWALVICLLQTICVILELVVTGYVILYQSHSQNQAEQCLNIYVKIWSKQLSEKETKQTWVWPTANHWISR